jgi:effector-binding domain-containing protein
MIDKIGIKTTMKELVAYKVLPPGSDDVLECAKFSGEVYKAGARPHDPTIILFYDPKDAPGCRKEVLIPVDVDVDGLDTKQMPEIRVAFIVFSGTYNPIEFYYEKLYEYIEQQGLKPSSEVCSLEAVYQPDEFNLSYGSLIDEDNPETWRTEIMVPVVE